MTDPAPRVRFAPSPTGHLHLGSALVALANRAFADRSRGTMLLRIDDTDRARSTPDAVEGILAVLEWLGIGYEEGPRLQRTRDDVYEAFLNRLLGERLAYPCFCSEERLAQVKAVQQAAGEPPRYDETCRNLAPDEVERRVNLNEPHVVRLRVNQDEAYPVKDLVRGEVAAPAGSFDDFILRRSDGTYGYLFASACDDLDFKITHVIRGEDHLPNTPRQLAILDALDADPPRFAHLPLLHSPGGGKLAKRDHLGSVDDLRRAGYLPRTVRRYLAELLGQGPVDLVDASSAFSLDSVPSSSPTVDENRLASLGREDIAALSDQELAAQLEHAGLTLRADELPLMRELAAGTSTLTSLRTELARVRERPAPPDNPFDEQDLTVLRELLAMIPAQGEGDGAEHGTWERDPDELVAALRAWGQQRELPTRAVLQPVRRALTGDTRGPALGLVLAALGPAEALHRLQRPLGGLTSQVSG